MHLDYDRVSRLLKEKKMTRRELARRSGISENTMSAAFRRKSKKSFSPEVLLRIAQAMDTDLYDILSDPEGSLSSQLTAIKSVDDKMNQMNSIGVQELDRIASLLLEISRFRKTKIEKEIESHIDDEHWDYLNSDDDPF